MNTSTKVISGLIVAAVAFAVGRYSVNFNKTETKTEDKQKDKESHTETTTTTTKKPDGETTTTTTTKTDTESHTETKKSDTLVVTASKNTNVSLLVAVPSFRELVPVYGISVTRPILGPITIGAFGLTNGTFGVSAGLEF